MDIRFWDIKVVLLFTFFILVNTNATAEWINPSEKYIYVYKNYEDAKSPISRDGIKHFVYFARDREAIHGHPFLANSGF